MNVSPGQTAAGKGEPTMTTFVRNQRETRLNAFATEPVSAEARLYCRVRSTWPASRGFEGMAAEPERQRIGICSKCRHRAELLLSDSVCGSCRDRAAGRRCRYAARSTPSRATRRNRGSKHPDDAAANRTDGEPDRP